MPPPVEKNWQGIVCLERNFFRNLWLVLVSLKNVEGKDLLLRGITEALLLDRLTHRIGYGYIASIFRFPCDIFEDDIGLTLTIEFPVETNDCIVILLEESV